MTGDFLAGANYLRRGFGLIMRPGLRRFFIIPAAINLIVFVAVVIAGIYWYEVLLDAMLPDGQAWWVEIARGMLWVLFATVVLVFMFFAFTIVANLLAAPFNGLLAENIERLQTGAALAPPSGGRWLARTATAVASELRKFLYYLKFLIIGLIMLLIPILNLFAPVYWVAMGAWMLAFEYLAYPMENHGYDFRQVRERLRQRRLLSVGFGASVMAASLVPVVNFLVMPAAVAGATLMWIDRGTAE